MSDRIGFKFRKIITEQFAIIESAFNKEEDVKFNLNIKYGLNQKDKTVAVFVEPTFSQNKNPFLILEMVCHFKVEEKAWDSFKNQIKDKLVIPLGFIHHLTMLAIGTARGALHSKTENTPFNNYLMPTINITEIIKNDVSFDLTS